MYRFVMKTDLQIINHTYILTPCCLFHRTSFQGKQEIFLNHISLEIFIFNNSCFNLQFSWVVILYFLFFSNKTKLIAFQLTEYLISLLCNTELKQNLLTWVGCFSTSRCSYLYRREFNIDIIDGTEWLFKDFIFSFDRHSISF